MRLGIARVRRLGGDRAGEIGLFRFLRNPSVTTQEMARTATARTAEVCVGRHVLAIQDTTSIDAEARGCGQVLHASLAVDAEDGAILGLIEGVFLSREGGRKGRRRELAFDEKESRRWLTAAETASQVCREAQRITMVADRESDIYDVFARRPANVDLVIRAAQDRTLGEGGRLFARADALSEAGRRRIKLAAKPGVKAREATLAARFSELSIAHPDTRGRGGLPKSVSMRLVDVREVDPPPGHEPVHWRLLTTHPVASAEAAFAIADLYRRRWAIEQLFRTIKTKGFDVENLQIEDDMPRAKMTMATLIAAVTIQQLVHARDGGPGPLRPITDAFSDTDQPVLRALTVSLEGKTERQKNPHPQGSLAYAAWVCARLGGWTGYYGKPGPIVILNGFLRFQSIKLGAKLDLTSNV